MSTPTAIGLVSQSLQNLLKGEFSLLPAPEVTLLSPDESGVPQRLNLFLYKVDEHAFLKNQDWQLRPGTNQLSPPPLSLKLRYLLTAYAPNDAETQNAATHAILGEAMRIFHQFSVIPTTYLASGLQGAREEIRVMLCSSNVNELATLWGTFSRPYRLSVDYEVSVVQIDALAAAERTMAPRVRKIGVPDVRAPFVPPTLTAISPSSGSAGTEVTLQGEHLAGWRATVQIGDVRLLDAQPLVADSFTVTLPTTLVAGFHEVRVDISHLHRSTHFFEVVEVSP